MIPRSAACGRIRAPWYQKYGAASICLLMSMAAMTAPSTVTQRTVLASKPAALANSGKSTWCALPAVVAISFPSRSFGVLMTPSSRTHIVNMSRVR